MSGAPPGLPAAPDAALTLVLVRHGETPMTERRAYSGSSVPGPPLTPRGRVQAAQAADLVFRIGRRRWPELPHPSAVVASPMVRTRETAAAVGRRLGASVRVDDRFAECDFGAWEGLVAAEIEAGWPGQLGRWHRDAAFAAPGGESVADVGARVAEGTAALLAEGAGRTVVVVAHSVVIRAAVGLVTGAPADRWTAVRPAPASVTVLRLWPDGHREAAVVGMPTDP